MYYKTLRNSETGLKFQSIEKIKDECTKSISDLSDKYGFKRWRHAHFMAWGGLSAVLFSENDNEYVENPDTSFWKEVKGGYLPKKNTAEGKIAYKEFQELPTIEAAQFNAAVDYQPDSPWSHIGASFSNPLYFLFSTVNDTPFTCPSDCVEITFTEYKTLSKNQ